MPQHEATAHDNLSFDEAAELETIEEAVELINEGSSAAAEAALELDDNTAAAACRHTDGQKKLQQVLAKKQKREQELERKTALYVERRKLMNWKLAGFGAFLGLVSNIFLIFTGGPVLLLFAIPLGAVAGWLIGYWGRGKLLSMPLFAASQGLALFLLWIVLALFGSDPDNIVKGSGGYNSIMFCFAIACYGIIGSLLGWWNEIFDQDHLQI